MHACIDSVHFGAAQDQASASLGWPHATKLPPRYVLTRAAIVPNIRMSTQFPCTEILHSAREGVLDGVLLPTTSMVISKVRSVLEDMLTMATTLVSTMFNDLWDVSSNRCARDTL